MGKEEGKGKDKGRGKGREREGVQMVLAVNRMNVLWWIGFW